MIPTAPPRSPPRDRDCTRHHDLTMRSIRHIARVAAAVIALSLAGAGTAQAQPGTPPATRIAARGTSQPALDRALREFGYNPGALRRDQQRALDDAWVRLFPEANRYRYTLNPTQATALVYVALEHDRDPRGGGGRGDGYGRGNGDGRGGWDDRNGNGGRDDDRNGRGGSQCVEINQRLYDGENALSTGTRWSYVSAAENAPAREALRNVQRLAVERGWRRVADLSSEAMLSLNANFPVRADVLQRIQAIKTAVDESCGQGDGRGGYTRP